MVRFASAVCILMLHTIAAKQNNQLRGGEMKLWKGHGDSSTTSNLRDIASMQNGKIERVKGNSGNIFRMLEDEDEDEGSQDSDEDRRLDEDEDEDEDEGSQDSDEDRRLDEDEDEDEDEGSQDSDENND